VVLKYLVTSNVRRDLLLLLWGEGLEASVSECARRISVRYSAAHRELEAMNLAGLAVCERRGRDLVYKANPEHPAAALLRALVNEQKPATAADHDKDLFTWLRVLGAPVGAPEPSQRVPSPDVVVAEALAAAHRDPTVALVLPVVLWKQRAHVAVDDLVREATRRNERAALGLFLELTGELAADAEFVAAARRLKDRRRARTHVFFSNEPTDRYSMAVAKRNTPHVARRWGYVMNMPLDSFASAFRKHTAAA
jgi:hypothetical protein